MEKACGMNDLTPNTELIILCKQGTERTDVTVGQLHVHDFHLSTGVTRIRVTEHSVFRINMPVTCTDIWQGQRQKQVTYEPGDLQFLPAGTEVSSAYVSRHYSETLIRIPHHLLQAAAHNELNLSSADLHYFRIPRSECLGLLGAVRNLAQAKARGAFIRPQTEDQVSEAMVISFLDGLMDHRKWGRPRQVTHSNPEGVRRAIELVESTLDQPVSLQQLAEAASMSTYHFARTFKATTGVTPMRFVWQRRIELARSMLKDNKFTLVEVALACGYSSQSHFTTAFKESTGLTPAVYRDALS